MENVSDLLQTMVERRGRFDLTYQLILGAKKMMTNDHIIVIDIKRALTALILDFFLILSLSIIFFWVFSAAAAEKKPTDSTLSTLNEVH